MKWLGSLFCWIGIGIGCLPSGYAEVYEGRTVWEVQVSCVSAEDLVTAIQQNIVLHSGDERFNGDLEYDALDLRQAIDEFEKRYIVKMLGQNQDHKGKAAAALNIDTKTLHRKMKKYQIIMP